MGARLHFTKRHPAQLIAFFLLICVACVIVMQNSQAAGGGSADIHLELNIKEGFSTQAVYVGLAILLFVYALIITEVVHRTLAAALGGLMAMVALNYYTEESALSLKGFNGIKESLIKEIKDQLNSRNMIKLKANKGVLDVSSRKTFWQELADKTNSKVINQIGNVAVFTKK